MKTILKLLFAISLLFGTQYGIAQSEVQSKEGQSNEGQKTSEKKEVTEGTMNDDSDEKDEEDEEPQIFQDYEWLKSLVDQEDCEGTKIYLKSKNGTAHNRFIVIVQGDSRKTYNLDGEIWCVSAKNIDCEEFYEMKSVDDEWTCEK